MATLNIWAPIVDQLEVELGGTRQPMQRGANGWHTWSSAVLVHDSDYALWVDGDGPLPDPRSPFQPRGVHGPSRWVDHGRFIWKTAHWEAAPLAQAVIYELHTGTFTAEGTFTSAIARLDELRLLGITHVELMPVAEFAGRRGWGYDSVNLYAPHHAYGGPDGLKQLVDACHRHGLGVIIDVVYNHFGPVGNYLPCFGPYFTDMYKTPWGDAVNLDGPGSDEVRRYFIDNALMWLRDYRADGLRLDAIHAYMDRSAVPFLQQLAGEVHALVAALGRRMPVIAESDLNDTRVIRPVEQGGMGVDAQWSDDFHHALHALITGEDFGYYADFGKLEDLALVLGKGFRHANTYSRYRRRHHGNSTAGLDGSRFVVNMQNHDQVGNRGAGERIHHIAGNKAIKCAAAVTLLGPFVPLLFQGEEWAASSPFLYFTDFEDPGLGEAVRQGRQGECAAFGWDPATIPDPQDIVTWRRSQLHWAERRAASHHEMLEWYAALITLRRGEADFAAGALDPDGIAFDEQARWLRFRRGRFVVLCNFSGAEFAVPTGLTALPKLRLATDPLIQIGGRATAVDLPACGVAVLETQARPEK